jgi:plasmid stability protein
MTASVDSTDCTASWSNPMATLTIRNLDESTKAQLRIQAARHGHSMEEEVRTILREAVAAHQPAPAGQGLGSRIQAHFAQLGGVELDLPERRRSMAQPAEFAASDEVAAE